MASESPHILSGEAIVTTGGTAVALSAARRVRSVLIRAKAGNTGLLYVGGSDVDSTVNDGLDAGESISFDSVGWMDLADIFIDADTNGEGVDFYAVKA